MTKDLKAYKVTCVDNEFNTYEVGVMTLDEFSARHCAENSLLEGRHIKAKSVKVESTDCI